MNWFFWLSSLKRWNWLVWLPSGSFDFFAVVVAYVVLLPSCLLKCMNQRGREGDVTSTCDSVSLLEPQGHINEVWTKYGVT